MRRPGTRLILGGIAALSILGASALAVGSWDAPGPINARPASERPRLMLVTTLPILFPEEFTLEGAGSRALTALESRYAVVPIGTTDAAALGQGRLLLLAHPLAQTAENLVALDEWVRAGGRVLLLADPRLEWPSKRPLGDRLRPPPAFADTGLLAHWGLRLNAPDEAGRRERTIAGRHVETVSPGSLEGECAISRDRLVARCRIGRGRATVIADADLLNVKQLGNPAEDNLDGLLAELAELER
jgi:hypothetical protein